MKKFFNVFMAAIVAMFLINSCACTVVDNSEVGLKFKKFSVTEQGNLETQPCSGYVWYNAE